MTVNIQDYAELPAAPGIYKITCNATSKIYVGSSQNIRKRLYAHLYVMRVGKHCNYQLHREFKRHGAEKFSVEVLEQFENRSLLIPREQFWLDELRAYEPSIGMNIKREASSVIKPCFEETKRKIALANTGKKRTPEQLRKQQGQGAKFFVPNRQMGRCSRAPTSSFSAKSADCSTA